jgi:hypothetical protein
MTTRNCTIAAVGLFLAVSGAIALSAARRTWQASPHRRRWRGFPVTDSYHGVPVVDEYRWLENGDDPKVKAWVAAQNAYSHAYLSKLPQREGIVSFLKAARAQQHVRYADRQYAGALLFALKIDPQAYQRTWPASVRWSTSTPWCKKRSFSPAGTNHHPTGPRSAWL